MDPLAIALGNPVHSQWLRRYDQGEPDLKRQHVSVLDCSGATSSDSEDEDVPELAETTFLYKADRERYDTGFYVTVRYNWNEEVDDCIENEALCVDGLELDVFRHEIVNKITHLRHSTLVGIKTTKDGIVEVSDIPVHSTLQDKAYPPLPDSLSPIPHVPISSLRKCIIGTMNSGMDLVTLIEDLGPTRQWYVFKRYAIPVQEQVHSMDHLLLEIDILSRLDSSYIIKPAFVVTDDAGSPTRGSLVFRGYLMPFLPAGSLNYVFISLRSSDTNWRQPTLLHPNHLEDYKPPDTRPPKLADHQLPWSLKHTWAIEATKALLTLHENGIYSGDVKLHNILLDREGHLQFIDVAPQSMFTPGYLAPELEWAYKNSVDDIKLPLTEARDMWAFGVVLWQIAEEEVDSSVAVTSKPLSWRAGKVGSTPTWYRNLVKCCMNRDPGKRPSAKDVLKTLEAKK